MSARRIIILFVYAFASMFIPVFVILGLNDMLHGLLTIWIEKNLTITVILFLIYGFAQIFIWFRMGLWAGAVEPKKNGRVSIDELRKTLLSLNGDKVPFVVVQDPQRNDRIKAFWKIADDKWIEIFAAKGLTVQYELRMKILEERGIVFAQDNFRKFEYTGGVGHRGVEFAFQFSFFKGISFFQYERGVSYGFIYKNGKLKFDDAYNYRFNLSEIKNPIIDIITGSGWEFRPTVFM
jgi:hypothetical protein